MTRGLDLELPWSRYGVLRVRRRTSARTDLAIPVVIAAGKHLFPFRTEKLSLPAPMVLGGQPPGRVGRRRLSFEGPPRRVFVVKGRLSGRGADTRQPRDRRAAGRVRPPARAGRSEPVQHPRLPARGRARARDAGRRRRARSDRPRTRAARDRTVDRGQDRRARHHRWNRGARGAGAHRLARGGRVRPLPRPERETLTRRRAGARAAHCGRLRPRDRGRHDPRRARDRPEDRRAAEDRARASARRGPHGHASARAGTTRAGCRDGRRHGCRRHPPLRRRAAPPRGRRARPTTRRTRSPDSRRRRRSSRWSTTRAIVRSA